MSENISRGFRMWLWVLLFLIGYFFINFFLTPLWESWGVLGLLISTGVFFIVMLYGWGWAAKRTE